MRDYDVYSHAQAGPSTGIPPEHLRYRLRHCVEAAVRSTVRSHVWPLSLDERLLDFEVGRELDGYFWGVKWHGMYPGAQLVPPSQSALPREKDTGMASREARITTNAHDIQLIFTDLVVETVPDGEAPFRVGKGP